MPKRDRTPTDARLALGNRIRTAREARGWSQTRLVAELGTGASQTLASWWETGKCTPRPEMLELLDIVLELPTGYLAGVTRYPRLECWERAMNAAPSGTRQNMAALLWEAFGQEVKAP